MSAVAVDLVAISTPLVAAILAFLVLDIFAVVFGLSFVRQNRAAREEADGQIEVARRWSEQKHGVHCRNGKHPDVNEYGIGICLVGDLDAAPPTARQVAAAKALIAYLSSRYVIASDHVGTHASLAQTPTACPGKYFPTQIVHQGTRRTVAWRGSSCKALRSIAPFSPSGKRRR